MEALSLCIIAPRDPQVYVHEDVDCPCIIAPHDPPGVYDCDPPGKAIRLELFKIEVELYYFTQILASLKINRYS